MANRNFPNGKAIYSQHVAPVLLDAQIVIGASGAVSSFTGKYIQSIANSGTGQYTVVLDDNYYSLLALWGSVQNASGVSAIVSIQQLGPMVNASVPAPPGATIVFQTVNASDAAANPASGAQINLVMLLNNSSVQ